MVVFLSNPDDIIIDECLNIFRMEFMRAFRQFHAGCLANDGIRYFREKEFYEVWVGIWFS